MGKYEEMSKQALQYLGGVTNITNIAHCATRLRIKYANKKLVDVEALKSVPEVVGVVPKDGSVQLIIGAGVEEAYQEFLDISGWKDGGEVVQAEKDDSDEKKGALYWMNRWGNFIAPVFMPIMPALICGGMVLAIRNLMINYMGLAADGGVAQMLLCLQSAAFPFMTVYIGYTMASQLKMPPIYGAMLGAVLICGQYASGAVTEFLGLPVTQIDYGGSVFPIMLGVTFEWLIYKAIHKYVPDVLKLFLTPLVVIGLATPVTLIALGPVATWLSTYVGMAMGFVLEHFRFIAYPLFSMLNPYFVMFGLDKSNTAIEMALYDQLGYDPICAVMQFISNISVGACALAIATTLKDKEKKGMISGFGFTGLCGVTEPAFYGSIIMRPKALIGTAIGSFCGGVVAALFRLRVYIRMGCPGFLTLLAYVDNDGRLTYVIRAIIVGVVTVICSFIATRILLTTEKGKGKK